MVWGQTENMGIGHGSSLQILQRVKAVCVFQPHPRLVVETRLNQGGEEREGKGGRAWGGREESGKIRVFYSLVHNRLSKNEETWCVRLGFARGKEEIGYLYCETAICFLHIIVICYRIVKAFLYTFYKSGRKCNNTWQ